MRKENRFARLADLNYGFLGNLERKLSLVLRNLSSWILTTIFEL
jgi:hypothetical protein